MPYDKTFCAAKCVNALCDRNKIYSPGADPLCSWADFSKECVEYEATDTIFIKNMPIEALMEKANKSEGLSWEIGQAFYELCFEVAYRLLNLNEVRRLKERKLTGKQKRGFEQLIKRLKLSPTTLPWKDQTL